MGARLRHAVHLRRGSVGSVERRRHAGHRNSGCILFWGYNPNIARLDPRDATIAALKRGARLIVVDPRGTPGLPTRRISGCACDRVPTARWRSASPTS